MSTTNRLIDRDNILKALTGNYNGKPKRNITFSLPERLIAEFKQDCENHGVKMNQVVQLMMEQYLGASNPGPKN